MESKIKADCNKDIGRFTTICYFLTKNVEFLSERCRNLNKRAGLDVSIQWLGALLDFYDKGSPSLSTPNTGGLFLWTCKNCPLQCAHNDFLVEQNGSLGYLMIFASASKSSLLVGPALHTYDYYLLADIKQLFRALKLKRIATPTLSAFVGHRYRQRAGAAYEDSSWPKYYLYFSSPTYEVHDGAVFACEDSMKAKSCGFKITMLEFSQNPESNEILELSENNSDRILSKVFSE